MTSRVSMLLKSRPSLTCFRACFLPGRSKDLSAPRYNTRVIEIFESLSREYQNVIMNRCESQLALQCMSLDSALRSIELLDA